MAPLAIELFVGPRSELFPLLRLADDSPLQIAGTMDQGEVLVARQAPQVIGLAQLVCTASTEWELKSLAVSEAQRSRGIGTALVRAALARAFDAGAARVWVSTATADIDNLRFYQRVGFLFERVERDVFTVGRGYPAGLESFGIPVRDRVWLSMTKQK